MTFQDIFMELKRLDKEDALSIDSELITITLLLEEPYKLVAYDNTQEVYLEILLEGTQINHFHVSYEETKTAFENAMFYKKPLPTKKEWMKISRYHMGIALAYVFVPLLVLILLIYLAGMASWIFFLRIFVFFGIFPLCWLGIGHFHKRYKIKNKDIYDKIANLEFL